MNRKQSCGSLLHIVSHSCVAGFTQANLSFTSVAARNYRLEYDEDLAGLWTNSALGTFPPVGSLTSGNLTGLGTTPRRFFRPVAVSLPTQP